MGQSKGAHASPVFGVSSWLKTKITHPHFEESWDVLKKLEFDNAFAGMDWKGFRSQIKVESRRDSAP